MQTATKKETKETKEDVRFGRGTQRHLSNYDYALVFRATSCFFFILSLLFLFSSYLNGEWEEKYQLYQCAIKNIVYHPSDVHIGEEPKVSVVYSVEIISKENEIVQTTDIREVLYGRDLEGLSLVRSIGMTVDCFLENEFKTLWMSTLFWNKPEERKNISVASRSFFVVSFFSLLFYFHYIKLCYQTKKE